MKRSYPPLTRVGAIAFSLLLVLTLFPLNAQKAFATDAVKGVEVHADSSRLEASVAAAKAAGVDVQKEDDVDKGTTESASELTAKKAEVEEDYNKQIADLEAAAKEAKTKLDEYATKKAAYDTAKAKYDTDKAAYDTAKAKYDTDLVAYNKAMEELEKKKNEDGYMSEPASQSLTFKSEPNATMSFPNGDKQYTQAEWQNYFDTNIKNKLGSNPAYGANDFNYINSVANSAETRAILHKDQPLKVTYTNLQNSSLNGKKISKVEYTYTLKGTGLPGVNDMPVLIEKDPTVTLWYLNFYGEADINMKVKFYGEDGQEIDPTGALINFSSLNHGTGTSATPKVNGQPTVEKVRSFNGQFIPISGSSITKQPDGGAYASNNNENKAQGSRFNTSEWDSEGNPNQWYGAIVGKITSPEISLNIGASKRGVVWFAFNSDIKAMAAPPKPVEPTPPTPPTEPEKPTIKATYHFDILYTKPQLEKKVLDENNNDINTNTVKTGSVVKFALNTTAFPAGHEKITSVVMNDVLPEGYKLNLEETKKASPDYEVSYDEGTRTLVFTAKATLLDQINADLTKEASVPAPIIVGTVTKEGATYENQFDLDINNVFKKKSNKVTVKTPEPPTPPTPSKKHKGAVPYTGDAGVLPSVALLATSMAALSGSWILRKKK